MKNIKVGVLGATGAVGQKFVALLQHHPYFRVHELVASERSAGKPYRDAVSWVQSSALPDSAAETRVKSTDEPLESAILFSGLDSSIAGELERHYAEAGHVVISNSKNHRMGPDVPLVIPEINADHLAMIEHQPYPGALVTNPNCSTIFLAMALAPLHRTFGVEAVQVSTMQAISGAGYPGLSATDIMGNVIPHISGEEEKLETETLKILGTRNADRVLPAEIAIGAQCNRVAVIDGHTETLSVKLASRPQLAEVRAALEDFRGYPQVAALPSAPQQALWVFDDPNRPQPARDLMIEGGMATLIGRLRTCPVFDVRMVVLGHNTIRGAAGAAILNAEALVAMGYFSGGCFSKAPHSRDACVEVGAQGEPVTGGV